MSQTVIRNGVEYHDGYFIASRNISIMEGKLLTLVELLGLPPEQSEAMKSEVRNKLWGSGFMSHGINISAEEIADFREQQKK